MVLAVYPKIPVETVDLAVAQTGLEAALELLGRELTVVAEADTRKILALVGGVVLAGAKLPEEEVVEPT